MFLSIKLKLIHLPSFYLLTYSYILTYSYVRKMLLNPIIDLSPGSVPNLLYNYIKITITITITGQSIPIPHSEPFSHLKGQFTHQTYGLNR